MKLSDCFGETKVIRFVNCGEYEVTGLCTDSKRADKGMLFFALAGVAEGSCHGKEFAPGALAAGALPVVDALPEEPLSSYVLVENARAALSEVSRTFYGHPERELVMLGVTGTKGKTTVTHILKHALEKTTGKKVGLIGTNHVLIGERELPSHNTTPEAHELMGILRTMVQEGCTYGVMEVSSHSLALGRVAGIRFACGAFLNLTHDHLDYHKTMENYAAAKALLFRQADRAVINGDADFAALQIESAGDIPTLVFSCGENNRDLTAKDIRLCRDHVSFTVNFGTELERVTMGIPGRFSVYNALAALGMLCSLGISLSDGAEALSDVKGVPGRCETVETGADFGVVVDYAHTPDSLENILRTVRDFTKNRLICVFGCGGNRDRTKRPEMGAIAERLADVIYVTSDNPRNEKPEDIIAEIMTGVSPKSTRVKTVQDRREAIGEAIREAVAGDMVVIAGKGHEDYQEIGGVRHRFDDREEAAAAIRRLKGE